MDFVIITALGEKNYICSSRCGLGDQVDLLIITEFANFIVYFSQVVTCLYYYWRNSSVCIYFEGIPRRNLTS